MKDSLSSRAVLEAAMGRLLRQGTYFSSAIIALGLIFSMQLAAAGIAMFILLPMARVAMMLFFFLRGQDYRLAAAAALVMAIVLLSYLLGSR
jgi:uncharacterized membrane protein